MMSYVWIFVLGSLIVTGVKMQEDGVEAAENDESPADDPAETVPDQDNTPTQDLDGGEHAENKETVDEATDLTETETEETKPDSDATEDEQPATEPAAEEKPDEEEAPVEAEGEGDAPDTEADPLAEETDVTEQEIKPEEAADEVEKEPAPESPDQEEPVQEEPAPESPDQEEPDQEEPDQEEPDQKEPEPESPDQEETAPESPDQKSDQEEPDQEEPDQDLGVVAEKPVETDEATKVHSRRVDPSDALSEDTVEGADKQSADQGKARSAGAASGPKDSGSGTVVGVVCGIAVAAVGAITGYFTYQKKKLCFKVQRGDPEIATEKNGTQSDPQVSSTLLDSP
ncbi:submandibular gland secretory Glx-rich protein CA isoform X2 [Pimephales promelas]|uniref:submandibular gland secretory Glx-rich protein CA isoform X2 n=1 Tax=Pimephales promelas TaxID=90988 RepID=UPI001955B766|nr:submandibular gland secretory Glx-rich protein CA isoform X2 [Pimephales promelas]